MSEEMTVVNYLLHYPMSDSGVIERRPYKSVPILVARGRNDTKNLRFTIGCETGMEREECSRVERSATILLAVPRVEKSKAPLDRIDSRSRSGRERAACVGVGVDLRRIPLRKELHYYRCRRLAGGPSSIRSL